MSVPEVKIRIQDDTCSRRDVLAALAKYSAVVGGSAATIVTADGLVSAASAYWSAEKWAKYCGKHPTHWKCADWGDVGGTNERIDF